MQLLKFFTIAALAASAAAQGPPLPDCDGLANSGYAVRDHVRSIANDGWAGNARDAMNQVSGDIENYLSRAVRSCHTAREMISQAWDSHSDAEDRNCQAWGC